MAKRTRHNFETPTSKAARLSEARLIDDEEEARQKYAEALRSADKEIMLITSSRGLKELSQDNRMLGGAIQKGVTIRIMAPIIDENQDAAKQLAEQTQVRHIEIGDLGTTIIDGKHIFQFKDLPIDQDMSQPMRLGKAYYSDDFEYVNKMKKTMEDIWKRAPLPSYTTWELSFGLPRQEFRLLAIAIRVPRKLANSSPLEKTPRTMLL